MYEEHVQGLKNLIESVNPQVSSINWSEVKYSLILDHRRLEVFYDEDSFESRKFELVVGETDTNFTTHTHLS
jgi:hypothetical protein